PTLDLRKLTPARVALGRAGPSLPTRALLDFTLDHARARDAVHASFDAGALVAQLAPLGIAASEVHSRAGNLRDYLRRRDLGRRLDEASAEQLAKGEADTGRLAIVIGDGLSPSAVHAHAAELMRHLLPHLAASQIALGPVAIATGARV